MESICDLRFLAVFAVCFFVTAVYIIPVEQPYKQPLNTPMTHFEKPTEHVTVIGDSESGNQVVQGSLAESPEAAGGTIPVSVEKEYEDIGDLTPVPNINEEAEVFNTGAMKDEMFAWWKPHVAYEQGLGEIVPYDVALDGKISPDQKDKTPGTGQAWIPYCFDHNLLNGGEDLKVYADKHANMQSLLKDVPLSTRNVVPSTGRVGSKLLIGVVRGKAKDVHMSHSHRWSFMYDNHKRKKVIFVFGDPIGVLLSLHQKVKENGCISASKWVGRHASNLRAKFSWKKQIHKARYMNNCTEWVNTMFQHDVMRLEEYIEGYHQTQVYPMLSIKYEMEHKSRIPDALRVFTGATHFEGFPSRQQLVHGSMSHVPRSERWAKLTEEQRQWLLKTYGRSQRHVQNAPDLCFWPAKTPDTGKTSLLSNPKRKTMP